ncbi:L-asparaginase 1 [Leucothrix sargassi]|nr:L-asparaginase 1 [Leucothrix sargassi]
MKILILYAGGTIGMEPTSIGYQPMPNFSETLKQQLSARKSDTLPEYDFISFERLIDSSDLSPHDWTYMGRQLIENWDKYCGFVLLHGTDTMAYSASMLSFMLQGCDKPVILTGSQIPMAITRSDALDNLLGAMTLASSGEVSEVCIYFSGCLIRGNRAKKTSSQNLTAFDSPNSQYLGTVGIKIAMNSHLMLSNKTPSFTTPEFDPPAVAVLHIYPGIQASNLKSMLENKALKGLILCTYGAGNPPAANEALMKVLEQANAQGICIVNISQCQNGGVTQGAYATGSALGKVGVISGHDMTLEAALTKLHFLIANGLSQAELKVQMSQSLCGEISSA